MPPPQLASPLPLLPVSLPLLPQGASSTGQRRSETGSGAWGSVWVAPVCCAREQVLVFPGWRALWGASWWTVVCSLTGCLHVSVCGGCFFLGEGGCVRN